MHINGEPLCRIQTYSSLYSPILEFDHLKFEESESDLTTKGERKKAWLLGILT
jgi:hypothetical protein